MVGRGFETGLGCSTLFSTRWYLPANEKLSRDQTPSTTSSHSAVRAYRSSCFSNATPYMRASSSHHEETTFSDTRPLLMWSIFEACLASSAGLWNVGRTAI